MTSNKNNKENNEWDKYSDSNDEDSTSVYNEKELNYLDKFLPLVQNAFDENELYDIILDCNFDDKAIENTISERIRYLKAKGSQYGWNVVDKKHRLKPIIAASKELDKEENKINNKNKKIEKKGKVSKQYQNKYKREPNKNYDKNNYYNYYEGPYNQESHTSSYNNSNYDNSYYHYDYYTNNKKNYNNNYYNYNYNNSNYYQDYNNYNNYYNDNYNYYSNYEGNSNYSNYGYYYKNNNYQSKYKKKRRPNNTNYNNRGNYYSVIKDYQSNENGYTYKLVELPSDYNINKSENHPDTNNTIHHNNNYEEDKITSDGKDLLNNISISSQQQNGGKLSLSEQLHNPELDQPTKENITYEIEKKDHLQVKEEFEEINVNKTDIENLRSYFDRLKHYTIFNEPEKNSTFNNYGQNYINGIYEQFSNFTNVDVGSSIPAFQDGNVHSNLIMNNQTKNQSERKIDSNHNYTINNMNIGNTKKSKIINNLTIQQPQLLEFTSDGKKIERVQGENIVHFSLFIPGNDKKQKNEEVTKVNNAFSTTNTVTANFNSTNPHQNNLRPTYYNNQTNTNLYENNYQQPDYSQIPNQNRYNPYMNVNQFEYPQENVVNVNEIYPQTPLEYSYAYNYYPLQYRTLQIPVHGYQNLTYGNYQERYNYQSPNNLQEVYGYYPMNTQGFNYSPYQQFNQNNMGTNMNSKVGK